jgi:hypothetical protein
VHIIHLWPIYEDVVALVITFFAFKAGSFSPDRPKTSGHEQNTPKMAPNVACGGLQRQVRLPARFYHFTAAFQTDGSLRLIF